MERVPYETLWIQVGEAWGIDPAESFSRVATSRRGGYCYQLNGGFGRLLAGLGYQVSHHIGGVHGPDGPSELEMTNHLVLSVGGLPTDANPAGTWYVDAGLGDALYEPLPLIPGSYRQGPLTFGLEEVDGPLGDWHLVHDPTGAFSGMAWYEAPAEMSAFSDRHRWLSGSPESGFVRFLIAQRRDDTGVDALRGLLLRRIGANESTRVLETRTELLDALGDVFGLHLDDAPRRVVDTLWERVHAAHLAWEAGGRPGRRQGHPDEGQA